MGLGTFNSLGLCGSQTLMSLLVDEPSIRLEGTWHTPCSALRCAGKTSEQSQWALGLLSLTRGSTGHLFGTLSSFLLAPEQNLGGITLFPCFWSYSPHLSNQQYSNLRPFPTLISLSLSTFLKNQLLTFFSEHFKTHLKRKES